MKFRPCARTDAGLRASRRRWLAAVGAAIAGLAGPARAREVIRYGGDADFPPFESLDDQGRPRGFQIDLLDEIARLLDVDIVVSLQPWSQTEAGFRQGRFDMVAMVNTGERQRWARFARGHATPAFTVYHRAARPEPQGLLDLAGLRVAVLNGDPMRDTLDSWLAAIAGHFEPFADATAALAAVRDGDADVALLPRAYADPVLAADATTGIVAGRLNHLLQSYAFAFAPDEAGLRTRVQRALATLEENGRLAALRVRWLSSHREFAAEQQLGRGLVREQQRTWDVVAVAGAALLLVGGAAWRRGRRVVAERQRRQHAEEALARAEDLLARTFTRSTDPMLVVERGSDVVRDANEALAALLGIPLHTLIGRPFAALGQHVDAAALAPLVAALASGQALDTVPLRLQRADGRERQCLVSADTLQIGDANHVFCIVRDVTEQLARDAALRGGYDALVAELEVARAGRERAEGALHEFTRVVAHDLKSPISAVHGLVGMLRSRLRAGHVQEALAYSEQIDRAARRMNGMVDALASLARVSQRPLRRQSVDMERLANETWALLVAAQPGRRVDWRIDPLPAAEAEPDLTAQVWQNLLDNAMKYSAEVDHARILVDSYDDERGTWYRVTDNGAGFDMAQAGSLFLPFQRMHSTNRFAGTGVGLSLVRRIVDHHQGEIRLRSSVGVGTVVEFTLEPPPPPG